MSLSIQVTKVEETSDDCTYAFGSEDERVGRVRVDKGSGDVELVSLIETSSAPSEQYCLAHVIPRLQAYHDEDTYPPSDSWDG